MGVLMEGFFDGVDVVFATPPPFAAAHGVPAEAPIPSTEPIPIDEGIHIKKISEATPILAETLTPQEGVIPPLAAEVEVSSPVTPIVISTNDPFAALSQAVKDGFSLVVTPSSIRSSTTRGPDADLFSEGSEDVLENPDNKPILKKRISDFDDEESVVVETEFMGMCPFFFLFLFLLLSLLFPLFLYLLLTCMYLRLPFAAISLYLYAHFPICKDL